MGGTTENTTFFTYSRKIWLITVEFYLMSCVTINEGLKVYLESKRTENPGAEFVEQ